MASHYYLGQQAFSFQCWYIVWTLVRSILILSIIVSHRAVSVALFPTHAPSECIASLSLVICMSGSSGGSKG